MGLIIKLMCLPFYIFFGILKCIFLPFSGRRSREARYYRRQYERQIRKAQDDMEYDMMATMEAFMDDLEVESEVGKGTTIRMTKKLGSSAWIDCEE